jgi:hypothetical protein
LQKAKTYGQDALRRAQLLRELGEDDDDESAGIRTFDPNEGRVVHHKRSGLPNIERLTRKIYARMWKDTIEVESAERHVGTMPDSQQILYATRSLKRKAQANLNRSLKRGVFDDETELMRMQHALRTEFVETVSHLGFDTEELSRIRVHNAATDEVIFEKAAYQAKLEVEQFEANAISNDVTRVGILQMQLNHFHQRNIPVVAPSKRAQASPLTGVDGGRRSSDRGPSVRAGVQAIVEKLQHGMMFQFSVDRDGR